MYRSTFSWPSALVGGEWSASCPCRFAPGKEPPVPQSRSGRYGEVKMFYPVGTRTPAPARSQSLYRLSYLDFTQLVTLTNAFIVQFAYFGLYRPSLDDLDEYTIGDANVFYFQSTTYFGPYRPWSGGLEECTAGGLLSIRHVHALARYMYVLTPWNRFGVFKWSIFQA
jgi:hypothetical protein